ncbi:MAG: glycosyltransferase family 4 protein, partial [Anaerolineaceae bacterium]|nr:glycosyltransferase family 4 protein [Anaerolineaceae bacterium]
GIVVPEIYHHTPEIEEINRNILGLENSLSIEELRLQFEEYKRQAKSALMQVKKDNELDLLMVDNIWSVAMNIPAAMALEEVRAGLGLRAIAHHHDFYWEKSVKPDWRDPFIKEVLETCLPPRSADITHVVINSLAQTSLKKHTGIRAAVIPNVFDFDGADWALDSYNSDLRQVVGLERGDICVMQATRIVPRKGIELAIDLVAALNEPHRRKVLEERGLADGRTFTPASRIILVLAGYDRDDPTGTYLRRLETKAADLGVELRLIDSIIEPERGTVDGKKVYSLWDAYTVADLVTYPSLWEGWGNQLLEALRAKLPIVVFEYPVYLSDIKHNGLQVISLGSDIKSRDALDLVEISTKILQEAADQCVTYLTDRKVREEAVNRNYQIARQNYSYETLENDLINII